MLTVWEPLHRLVGESLLRPNADSRNTLSMPLDILENGETLVITAALSGTSKDKFSINYDNQVLTIGAEVARPEHPPEAKVWASERPYGQVVRRLRLPYPVNVEAATAEYTDGTLTLILPKAEIAKTRTISVN